MRCDCFLVTDDTGAVESIDKSRCDKHRNRKPVMAGRKGKKDGK